MTKYKEWRSHYLPFGCWIFGDGSVVVYNRAMAPVFRYVPGEGVFRVEGERDTLPGIDCIASVIFRHDDTFTPGTGSYLPSKIERLERSMLEWSVAADVTRLEPIIGATMPLPALPSAIQRFVRRDLPKSMHRVVREVDTAFFTGVVDDFTGTVLIGNYPPQPRTDLSGRPVRSEPVARACRVGADAGAREA